MTTQLQTVPVASYDENSQTQPQAWDYTYADSLYACTPEPTNYPLPNDDLRDILADYTSHTRMVCLAFKRERHSLDDREALLERQTSQLVDSRFEVAEDRKALEVEKAKFNRQRIEKEQEYEERLAELEARKQAQAAIDAWGNDPLPHFLKALEGMRSDVVDMFESLESKVADNADIIAEVHDAVTQDNDLTSCNDLAVQLDTATVRVDRLSDVLAALNRACARDVKRVLEAIAACNQVSPSPSPLKCHPRSFTMKRERPDGEDAAQRKRPTLSVKLKHSLSPRVICATPSPEPNHSRECLWSHALDSTASGSNPSACSSRSSLR